ncbi:MAG: hypothetical protein PHV18_02590 [Lachnospiraceae bacterium]|nr:hypothetical protein [Lachnospiraceae bacterium]
MRKIQKILTGVFLGGVLLGGIGTGVAVVEYSSISYAGEKIIGNEKMVTENFDYTLDPEVKRTRVGGGWFDGLENTRPNQIEMDQSVPEGVVRYRVTYNSDRIKPYLSFFEDSDGENMLWLDYGYQDGFALWMENKDEVLRDLKQGQIASYRTSTVSAVKILVNPATKDSVVLGNGG